MPPRRSGRNSSATALATPIKRDADSPEINASTDTPSGNNTTRSNSRVADTPITPATSISDDDGDVDLKPRRVSKVKKEEPVSSGPSPRTVSEDEDDEKFAVYVPPPPPRKVPQTIAHPSPPTSSVGIKRKRGGGFVAASELAKPPAPKETTAASKSHVKAEPESDDDVTFVSANTSRVSARRAAAPRKSYKEEEDSDDEPLITSTKSKGKQRQKDEEEAAVEAAFAIADEIRNYAFDSDDELSLLSNGYNDDDEKHLSARSKGRGKRKAKAAPRIQLMAAAAAKKKAEDDEGDVDDWIDNSRDDGQEAYLSFEFDDVGSNDSEDSDFNYTPPAYKRRAARGRGKKIDTESELSDIDDDDDDDTPLSVKPEPADVGEGSSAGAGASTLERGRFAEDLRYETAKQRRARLKSEKYAASRKKKPALTQYQKTVRDIEFQHPELKGVWERLSQQPTFNKKHKADQPDGLTISLLPFQLEGLNWLKQQEQGEWKGGILADEMGMGKTIQMISLFLSDRKKPTLVVAPTVAIMQWRNEIAKYTSDFKVLVWHGASREADASKLQKYDVILTSYAILESSYRKQEAGFRRKGEILKEKSAIHSVDWHRIVLDEAHNIKERATNTAKGAFALSANYRWCLSGTPLQNRVGELYSMIRFLNGDPYAYYYCKRCPCKSLHWQFSDRRSCDKCGHTPMHHLCLWNVAILRPIQREGTSIGDGAESFGRLRTLLEKIMLRRTKLERADDMGLPPRTLVVRKDFFSEEEEDLYDSLYRDGARKFSTYIDAGTVLNNYSNIFTLLTRMRQLACHPDLVFRSKTGIQQKLLGDGASQNIHVCRICAEEATDPIKSQCKHVFCRECVRQYLDTAAAQNVATPDCPYCHATLSIQLEQDALEDVQPHETRQGILGKIDMEKWRSSTKIEALVEELNNVRREDSTIKSIVFSQFVNFLDLITFRLQRAGFKVCRLEGNMTPEARDRTIRYFMDTPDVTVFLVSLKAGGVALNLTEASRVYLMDPWWNGAVSAQAMDRIHRLGQRRPIVIKQMIIQDSIEARMLELQDKKQNMVNATLANDDSAVGRLSVADLQFLFSLG